MPVLADEVVRWRGQSVELDARVDGVVVTATAHVHEYRPYAWYVSNVLVAWWGRGRGVGSQLMRAIVRKADEVAASVELHCRHELVGWYRMFGFTDLGLDDGVFGGGLHHMVRVNEVDV